MKNIIIGFTFILMTNFVYGQQLNMQIKAYAGARIGVFNEKTVAGEKDIFHGYQGGFGFRVTKGKAFLEPGFSFQRSYFQVSDSLVRVFNEIGIADPRVKYNSFEFPIVIGYKFIDRPIFKWYAAGGFAMNVSIKSNLSDGKESILNIKSRDLGFSNPMFTMRMGTVFDIAFFTVDVYYNIGLNSATRTIYRTQTHSLEINLGFLF